MDEKDRELMLLLGANPRAHVRELARTLGISKQAVHHRMQVLIDSGVIRGTMAGISIPYLDAVPVTVFGASKARSIEEMMDRLGEDSHTRRVVLASGNYLYVVGFLRKISELDRYVKFVSEVAEVAEPTVGIYSLDDGLMQSYSVDGGGERRPSYRELTPLDLKIIASIKDNARRPVAEIAEMIGVSPKTVRRHLEAMISEGSLDMSLPVDMSSGGDFFLVVNVGLKEGADKRKVGGRIISKRLFRDQYVRTFSNLPRFLAWVFWSDKMNTVRSAVNAIGSDEDVQTVVPNIVYLERLYSTWRDELPAMAASKLKSKNK